MNRGNWCERNVATKYLSVSVKGSWSVTCAFFFSIFKITFLASTPEGSYSVIALGPSDVTVVFSCVTLVYVWKSRFNAELSNWISSILMSIEWGIVMQCFWVVEIFHEYLNLQFWNWKQLEWTIIQFMPLVTKSQIKSVTNDYPKFYMLQVMLFMTNEPAKNKK